MARATITIAYNDSSEVVISGTLNYIEERVERGDIIAPWDAWRSAVESPVRLYTLSILTDAPKESWDDEWL